MKKIYSLSIFALIVLISSCKKDNSIGANLLTADDLLNAKFVDTFTINAKTIEDTFLRTDKLARNYLGVIDDGQFGTQHASIVMELDRPSNIYDDTLGRFTVDSAVLFLKYNSVYGDTLTAQSFTVNKIDDPIDETKAYYSNNTSFPGSTLLGTLNNYTYTPTRNPVHTTTTDTVGTVGLIRIELDKSFFENNLMNLGQNTLRDSLLFKTAFRGIRVENSNSTGNAMAEVDLSNTSTYLSIFYKDKYGVAKQSKLFPNIYRIANGTITPKTNSINLFSHSFSGLVQSTVNSGFVSDQINYLLGQGGTLVKVNLPTLENLGKVAVNKAVLQVTQIVPNTPSLLAPATAGLFLVTRNSDGNLDFIPSYIAPYYDGYGVVDSVGLDLSGNKLVRYSINISKYVQNISKGTQANAELYIATYRTGGTDGTKNLLTSYNYGYTPTRVALAGSNFTDPRFRMKLNLTYTAIK